MTEVSTHEVAPAHESEPEEITLEEGQRLLDEAARRLLHMTGAQFLEAWDQRGFSDPDSLRVQQVAALLPFAR